MFYLLWLVLKATILLAGLVFALVCWKHYNTQALCKFYCQQKGVVKMKGSDTFFLGNAVQVSSMLSQKISSSDTPRRPML